MSTADELRICTEVLDDALRRAQGLAARSEAELRTLTLRIGETIKCVLAEPAVRRQRRD